MLRFFDVRFFGEFGEFMCWSFLGFTGLDSQKNRGKTEAYQWRAKGIYTPIMFGSRHLRHLSKGHYARLGQCSCNHFL